MAGDLERFLQQAAERLAQKVNQQNQPRPRPARSMPTRQAERAPLNPEIVDAEIVEAEVIPDRQRRESGPNPLSNLDTRPGLAEIVSQADESMSEHIHQALDHDLGNLGSASAALDKTPGDNLLESQVSSQVDRREKQISPMIAMLRNPDSLRAAFIASQIFDRKF